MVIVAVSVSLALFGMWARNLVQDHRRLAGQRFHMQAIRLAEAGLQRALARRTADPAFTQETWTVPAQSLGGTHAATVQIRVTPNDAATAVQYEATARYPADTLRQAQVTHRIEIPTPSPENES